MTPDAAAALPPFLAATSTGRLPWPALEELAPERAALHRELVGDGWSAGDAGVAVVDDAGRLLGPFNAMAINPHVGRAVSTLGVQLRHGTSLSGRERELAILQVAVAERSGFEWWAHHGPALQEGLSPAEVEAVRTGGPVPSSLDTREQAVHEVAGLLSRDGDLPDRAWAAAVSGLGLLGAQELVWLVGYYAMVATALRVARVPLPADRADPFAARLAPSTGPAGTGTGTE